MSSPMIGTIVAWAPNFAPRGWMFCQGQTLAIQQYTALFSLLGTVYGGNGQTTFMLPDLRGRVPVGAGAGPGLSQYVPGQAGGGESTTLTGNNLPSHVHGATFTPTGGGGPLSVSVKLQGSNSADPNANSNILSNTNNILATSPGGTAMAKMWDSTLNNAVDVGGLTVSASGGGITGGSVAVAPAGNSMPFDQRQPYLALNFIIAVEGLYPSRN